MNLYEITSDAKKLIHICIRFFASDYTWHIFLLLMSNDFFKVWKVCGSPVLQKQMFSNRV